MAATKLTAKNASKQAFIPVIRELVRAYQAFEAHDIANLRKHGLTAPQADVIFTLGNTEGMAFKEIGEHTLITKGTLTGVVDRLEEKGIVKRVPCPKDRRRMYVVLTTKGVINFERVFPQHIAYLKLRFDRLTQSELANSITVLKKLRGLF